MEDLEGCILDQAIKKVKFFFRLSISTHQVLSRSNLAFFLRLTELDLLVRLSFAWVFCEWLSDKAEETVIDSLLVKDLLVKLALMSYLVLSDTILAHVSEQIGIVNSAPCQS